jgi:hypothetical protein
MEEVEGERGGLLHERPIANVDGVRMPRGPSEPLSVLVRAHLPPSNGDEERRARSRTRTESVQGHPEVHLPELAVIWILFMANHLESGFVRVTGDLSSRRHPLKYVVRSHTNVQWFGVERSISAPEFG